ncbi:hypothetical protein [Endobacterium cereale]|uniref:hypothetical protein n=1 Tax=Endobacterium cereale TaxID=2663029 RepID=UPI002B460C05|nr:hypothetical protein [Endobacterium cereale]MEB2845062.1 hypothetical protein [Endobacterium cereale]
MLPPVPATPVAHAMQANQRQASTQQVEQGVAVPGNATQVTASPVVGGTQSSMELLDLSGQVRLAQSLSVFAETLGGLLKLPRREGEALADYSKRLAAAINALSATERARLQTQLNQIMQGATLRLLADLLKDPSGPAAARLAVQIEIAQYQEQYQGRDLAARHAVNSYRQNNGNDLPANGNGNGNRNTAVVPNGVGTKTLHSKADATTATPNIAGGALPNGATETDALLAKAATFSETKATPAVAKPVAESATSASGQAGRSRENAISHLAPETKIDTDGDAAQANRPVADSHPSVEGKTAPAIASEARQQTARGESALFATARGTETPTTNKPEPKAPTIYDAAALVRLAHGESNKPVATIARAIFDGFQADWIADLLTGETDAKNARQVLPAQGGQMPLAANSEEIDTPKDAALPANRQVPTSVQADENAPEPVIGPLPQTANPLSATAMIAAQPDTAFEKALLGMTFLPREVPGHPLVPQDGTPEFDDEQNHEVRRKSAVGDDEQPSRREHQGFHQPSGGDEQPTDGDEQPAELILPGDEMEHPDTPDSMPTTSGLKQAPRQHLSDHPSASAEDLYRRLASLE